jgi:hypothetical protein
LIFLLVSNVPVQHHYWARVSKDIENMGLSPANEVCANPLVFCGGLLLFYIKLNFINLPPSPPTLLPGYPKTAANGVFPKQQKIWGFIEIYRPSDFGSGTGTGTGIQIIRNRLG